MNVASEERLIRRWVDQLRPFGRGRTYTPKLRERIIKFVELAKAAGIKARGAELVATLFDEAIMAGDGDRYTPVIRKQMKDEE